MSEHFYSTTACTIISYWPPEVADLIYEFSLKTPAAQKKALIAGTAVSAEQLNEAREDSYELVKEYLAANAEWQKTLNEIDTKRQLLADDLALTAKTIKKLLELGDKIKTEVSLPEIEKQHKDLKEQELALDNLTGQLAIWRTKELEVLKRKWEKHWQEHKKHYATELIQQLKNKCDIELSEIEQIELNAPTKTRDELLKDLNNFYPDGLPKGWDNDSDL
ncbi:MAG: hypothetical protein KAT71_04320, partial [Gammaproteobacteria bacterium]|nr:hypothetical protein [Gammaproteobacteria bacterium]